jgi:formimidoylglutamate deiminase
MLRMGLKLHAPVAMLPDEWAREVLVEIDDAGVIAAVTPDAAPGDAERLAGPLVPGMPNLHSHAFQRAIAGRTERRAVAGDSFWTWREEMYRFASRVTPEDLLAIAAQLDLELLKQGYTSVAEFHYLHHDREGRPFADRTAMAEALVEAARGTGIAITVLPVLYERAGFDGSALSAAQRRFATRADDVLRMVARMRERHRADSDVQIGVAPHSLRAVSPDALAALLDGLNDVAPTAPIHMHAAEQLREVEDCRAWSGLAPVEWLLRNAALDGRWCLVHCTHTSDRELAELGARAVVVGLCPTTEANLGDGVFPLDTLLASGGRFGVGSDSNVSQSPVEELRWLEYGQRLLGRRRNVAATNARPCVGASLWRRALHGGAQALGRRTGAISPGLFADLAVLDGADPRLAAVSEDAILDALVFAGNTPLVRDVFVSGRRVLCDGRAAGEEAVAQRYREAIARLVAA